MGKTFENLVKAFVGESQARNRYTIYSKVAKKEGFEQIAAIFAETADNEAEHAKWFFRMANELNEGKIEEITLEAASPLILGNTAENLKAAVAGEHFENSSLYPEFANIASEEGHKNIAVRIRAISSVEAHHEARYKELLKNVEDGTVFKKEVKVYWICRKCGYVHEGLTPPPKCPSCNHPESYFQVLVEQY